jgi:putative nucleotidyltransferase-like protein
LELTVSEAKIYKSEASVHPQGPQPMTGILEDIVAEGERLLGLASRDGLPLRLLGGVAIRIQAPEVPPALTREYKDLDLAVTKKRATDADKLLREAGYEPHVSFNAMHARERGLYFDETHGRQVDLFIHSFRMCHEIPLGDRLERTDQTVPLAELLLTKLQIIEVNEKDIRDTVLLFHGHAITDDDSAVNGARIAELCGADWGLWRTITANLDRCRDHVTDYDLPAPERARVQERLDALLERIEAEPKTRGWRLRAKVGDRKRWYDLPEEVE